MDSLDQGISALKGRQIELATQALNKPQGRDAFEFGRVCGINQGLGIAVETLTSIKIDTAKREALS